MKRIVIKCPECGREQYIDMHDGTEEVQEQVMQAFDEGSAEVIEITCPCGGVMDVSAVLDVVLDAESEHA